MDTLYENLLELCNMYGISGAKMCTDIGLSKSLMTGLKKGRRSSISMDTAKKISSYFGVSVEYLFGKGPKNNPLYFCRKIFPVMHEQRLTLDVLSEKTGIAAETIRTFALGGKIDNSRDCLEELAKVLNVSEAYLMGWTGYKEDPVYWLISPKAWECAGQDPDEAYHLYQCFDFEEYYANEEEEEEKSTTQEDDGLTENQRILMEYVRSVPDDKAEMILRVIRSIVEAD